MRCSRSLYAHLSLSFIFFGTNLLFTSSALTVFSTSTPTIRVPTQTRPPPLCLPQAYTETHSSRVHTNIFPMPSELGLHCLKAQDNSHPAVLVPAQAQVPVPVQRHPSVICPTSLLTAGYNLLSTLTHSPNKGSTLQKVKHSCYNCMLLGVIGCKMVRLVPMEQVQIESEYRR